MEQQILDFIKRRFPIDCHWLDGNCFFFAKILAARFIGTIMYDPIDGHFLFKATDGQLYDWTGQRKYTELELSKMIEWENYALTDLSHYQHIWRDCVN